MYFFAAATRGLRLVTIVCAYCCLLLWALQARAEEAAAPAAENNPHFDVWEFRVTGNTLLSPDAVERTLYPFLGPNKTINDVQAAATSLQQRYTQDGYHLAHVDIPEQAVDGGVVRLEVTEGRVLHSEVTGSRYFSPMRIRSSLPALQEGDPMDVRAFQAQLAALNAVTADRVVTPVFRPGLPGTAEVELRVKDQLPLHGSVELNDRYSLNTSRLRLEAGLSYANLWQREHSLSVQYQTAPENTSEVEVWAGTYVWRNFAGSSILALYGVHSASEVAAVGAFQVLGKGDIAGLRLITPFESHEEYSHSLTLGVDYKDLAENLSHAGGSVPVTTPISYLPFSLGYSGTVTKAETATRFDIGAHFGVRGLGDDDIDCEFQQGDGSIARQRIDEFACKRAGAKPNFIYLTAGFEHTRPLPQGMLLRMASKGQLADSPLVSNEQMSAGGVESVRGYVESERLGDSGVQLNLDLRSPPLLSARQYVQELYGVLFGDAAYLKVNEALPGQDSHYDLAGAGFGLRGKLWDELNATLHIAWPFTNGVETKAGEPRLHFAVSYAF